MSVFKSFISLRDKLSESLDNNVSMLQYLSGIRSTLPTANKVPISDNRVLEVTQGMLSLYDSNNQLLDSLNFEDVSNFNTTLYNGSETWSDLIDEVSDSANSYQVMADLATKYSYTNRISYSDVSNYVSSYSLSSNHEIQDALFTASDEDGYISRNSFTTLLEQWFANGKATVDNESFDVDKTNPYSLQAVINIVVSAVTAAVTIVCTVLSGIFGVIGLIIGGIVSGLMSAVNAIEDLAELSWNPDSSNQYVKGPIMFAEDLTYEDDVQIGSPVNQGSHVYVSESNGIAIFTWPKNFANMQDGFRSNAYIYPYWKPFETLRYLKGYNALIKDSNYDRISFTHLSHISDLWRNPYTQNLKYAENEAPTSEVEIGASLLVGFMIQQITGYAYFNDVSAVSFYASYQTSGASDAAKLWLAIARLVLDILDNSFTDANSFLIHAKSIIKNGVTAYANFIKEDIIPYRGTLLGAATDINDAVYRLDNASCTAPVLKTPIFGNRPGVGNYQKPRINLRTYISDAYDLTWISDTIPSDWGVTLPQYDSDKLSRVLIGIGITATVIAIAGTKLKKVIAKKKIGKQAYRADQVNKAREEYLADPTNVTKRKDFEDKAYKYNKLGKWFGWGSYDAANGWVDSSSASGFGGILESNGILANLGSSDTTINSIDVGISEIRRLIK